MQSTHDIDFGDTCDIGVDACSWADDINLPDIPDAYRMRGREWQLDINEMTLHTTRKFAFTVRQDTLLAQIMGVSRMGWERLPETTRIGVIKEIRKKMRNAYCLR